MVSLEGVVPKPKSNFFCDKIKIRYTNDYLEYLDKNTRMNAKLEENRTKTRLYRNELKFQKIHSGSADKIKDKSIDKSKNAFGDLKGEPPGQGTNKKVIFVKPNYAKKSKGKSGKGKDSSGDSSWIRKQAYEPQLNDSRDTNDVSLKFCANQ